MPYRPSFGSFSEWTQMPDGVTSNQQPNRQMYVCTYYMSGTVLGSGNSEVNKTDKKIPALMKYILINVFYSSSQI